MAIKKQRRKFRAEGNQVWAEPITKRVPGGTSISLGFLVAQVNDNLVNPKRLAKGIAKALNESTTIFR